MSMALRATQQSGAFKRMETKTLADRIYELLLEQIVAGELEPGSKIVIDRIAKEHAISLHPIREAMARLSEHGVLRYSTNKGYQVAPSPTVEEYSALFRARLAMEYGAIQVGFGNVDDELVRRLKAINKKIESIDTKHTSGAFEEFTRLNNDFHIEILSLANSAPLQKAYERVGYGPQVGREMYSKGAPDRSNNVIEHNQIISAFEKRDKNEALRALESHILSGMERFLKNFPNG